MNSPSLLIMDSCKAHLTDGVKKLFKNPAKIAVIPGGLTKVLQPLDLCVNRSFKPLIRKKWERCMVKRDHEFTKR
jgi:hypothetical protein